jgi:hypothetical protein
MPMTVHRFEGDPIEMDSAWPFATTTLAGPAGSTVITGGGIVCIRDTADGETYFYVEQSRRVAILRTDDDNTIVIKSEDMGGPVSYLQDAWICYWEDEA